MIENARTEWTSEDVDSLRIFLTTTKTGQKLVSALAENCPGLLPGGDINAILIRSGEVRGFSEAVRTLFAMAYPAPNNASSVQEAYPALEDDSKWNDNNTVAP